MILDMIRHGERYRVEVLTTHDEIVIIEGEKKTWVERPEVVFSKEFHFQSHSPALIVTGYICDDMMQLQKDRVYRKKTFHFFHPRFHHE